LQQPLAQPRRLRREGRLGRPDDVDQPALADPQPEDVAEHALQPREADVLAEAQVQHQRPQVRPERRAGRHLPRRRRLEAPGAVRAGAAHQRHPRHLGADRREVDVVVSVACRLRRRREVAVAMRAAGGADLAHLRRVRVERAGAPRPALAPALGLTPAALRLAPRARRQAGVLRRLRRQPDLGLELRHPLVQLRDQLGLRQHDLDKLLFAQGCKIGAIHPKLESRPIQPVKGKSQGVSSYA
jgi:hypothetical protein